MMGLAGSYTSARVIFFAAAGLCFPALLALAQICPSEIDYRKARNAGKSKNESKWQSLLDVVKNRKLLVLTLCLVLFQFADASMLPLIAENIGSSKEGPTSLMTSGLIAAPQLVVMLLSPWIGYFSESWGRKPLLLAGFVIESLRGLLLATMSDYVFLVLAQVIGGITAAIVNVLTVLIVMDLTTGTGRFNLTQGGVLMFSLIAASVSTASTGIAFQALGHFATFAGLASASAAAAVLAWIFLPETKPARYLD
jgi:predicted MFS family arabinose efflux permease